MITFNTLIIIIFWCIAFLFFTTWFLYPCSLYIIRLALPRKQQSYQKAPWPSVSFIIPVYNEEHSVKERIENIAGLDYPPELMQVVIVSDGSTDSTNSIVSRMQDADSRITLIAFNERRGIAVANNEGVRNSRGDILVFTDAQTRFRKDYLTYSIPHFSDTTVGCVTGFVRYRDDMSSSIVAAANLYWKYEEFLRRLASDAGVLACGTGAALAVRRTLYRPAGSMEGVDRVMPLEVKIAGYRVIHEPGACVDEYFKADTHEVHRKRAQKTSKAFRDVFKRLVRIHPVRHPMLFISVFFHKTSRHLTPVYLGVLFLCNILLLGNGIVFKIFFIIHAGFYACAAIGWMLERRKINIFLFSIPYNFVLLNISRACGLMHNGAQKCETRPIFR